MPETQNVYQQKLQTPSAAGPRQWSSVLWAEGIALPKPVGAQMMPWCWNSSCQTWSCRFHIGLVEFQSCFGPAFPCYFSFRNENHIVPLCTANINFVFLYHRDLQPGVYLYNWVGNVDSIWMLEVGLSTLGITRWLSPWKPSMNIQAWAHVFRDSVPSCDSVLESCEIFRKQCLAGGSGLRVITRSHFLSVLCFLICRDTRGSQPQTLVTTATDSCHRMTLKLWAKMHPSLSYSC